MRSLSSDAGEAGEGDDASKGQTPAGVHQPSVVPGVALDTLHEDKQGDDGGRDDHQDSVCCRLLMKPRRNTLLVSLFRFKDIALQLLFSLEWK